LTSDEQGCVLLRSISGREKSLQHWHQVRRSLHLICIGYNEDAEKVIERSPVRERESSALWAILQTISDQMLTLL
jgi:hypothetical protein